MTRRLALLLVPAVAVTATAAVAVAAPPKPKPITKTYTATATPDPTSSNVGEICDPQVNPTARHSEPFKVPAAGTLLVKMANTLDWSLAVRQGGDLVASSDGGTPETVETVSVKFKKATAITIDSCNFAGEPSVDVTYTFTYK